MQLKSLHLKNIKNHSDLKVNFTSGITAILGRNGVGKTTILESIGFVLFDYLLPKQKEFISHGKTWGEVELSIEMEKDSWIVLISRRIGNNPYYKITTGISGDIIGKEDVQQWIHDNLSIDMELPKLYSEIIAIPQGLATAHFLLAPRQREEVFNSILGVDIYRDCWEKLRPVEKLCNEQTQLTVNTVKVLEEKLENFDEEVKKEKDYKEQLQNLSIDKEKVEKNVYELTLEVKNMNEINDMVINRNILEEQIKDRRQVIKEVEGKRDARTINEEKFLELEKELECLPEKEKTYKEMSDSSLGASYKRGHILNEIDKQKITINNFNSEFVDYEKVSNLAEKLDNIKGVKENIEKNITIWEAELDNLPTNGSGTCPILKEKCDKIDSETFKDRISELSDKVLNANELLYKTTTKFNECYRAKEIKEELDQRKEHIDEIKSLLTKNEEIVNKIKEENDLLMAALTKLREELEELNKKKEEYSEMKQAKEMEKYLSEQISTLNEQLQDSIEKFDELTRVTSNYDSGKHRASQDELDELKDTLSRLEEKCSYIAKEQASQAVLVSTLMEEYNRLQKNQKIYKEYEATLERIKKIRDVFKNVGKNLVETYLSNISYRADQIYQSFELKNSNNGLVWENDYNIKVGNENFNQLSGAEKLCAAIAIRLALLEYFSSIKILVLDEPTDALDDRSKENLGESIKGLNEFNQILLVTHDKEFSYIADNIVNLD